MPSRFFCIEFLLYTKSSVHKQLLHHHLPLLRLCLFTESHVRLTTCHSPENTRKLQQGLSCWTWDFFSWTAKIYPHFLLPGKKKTKYISYLLFSINSPRNRTVKEIPSQGLFFLGLQCQCHHSQKYRRRKEWIPNENHVSISLFF